MEAEWARRARGAFGAMECNLCMEEIKSSSFIITACNHAFCMEHENNACLQASTCPCCGQSLPLPTDIQLARYVVRPEEERSLCGLLPCEATKLMLNSLGFWQDQERTRRERLVQELTKERERVEEVRLHVAQLQLEVSELQEKLKRVQKTAQDEREVREGELKRKRDESPLSATSTGRSAFGGGGMGGVMAVGMGGGSCFGYCGGGGALTAQQPAIRYMYPPTTTLGPGVSHGFTLRNVVEGRRA